MDNEHPATRDPAEFREIVRNPRTHAVILGQYRIGEYAGVVALHRLLGEMRPEGKLHEAMTIHHRDEARHSQVFTDWMRRLGVEPPPLPTEVEGYFSNSPEEFAEHRRVLEQLPPDMRRIIVFAGINAIERLAFTQFETHLGCLDRAADVAELRSVMEEEKFHLSYVERELERQSRGDRAGFVATALEQARAGFARFQETRRAETARTIERLLGTGV
jgi:hypothetical protein